MSLIKNLIKETGDNCNTNDTEGETKKIVKTAIDLQRLKLEKLMKNPDKPVIIPEHKKEKDFMQTVPTFVRNVMGSSAGAGSGEFHVYRHLRRKEYARQKMIQSKSHQEILDEEYQLKLAENRRKAEEKTAKKRAKRLKKKNLGKKNSKSNKESNMDKTDDEDTAASESDVGKTINESMEIETNDLSLAHAGSESTT